MACLMHPDSTRCILPVPGTTDLYVGCGPCQPFSTLRCTGPEIRDHEGFPATFAGAGSILSTTASVLPSWGIGEQVLGFGKEYKDAPESPKDEFFREMLDIKRPDGSRHFAGFASMKIDSHFWVEGSRPRSPP
jgi:hypothetical protein